MSANDSHAACLATRCQARSGSFAAGHFSQNSRSFFPDMTCIRATLTIVSPIQVSSQNAKKSSRNRTKPVQTGFFQKSDSGITGPLLAKGLCSTRPVKAGSGLVRFVVYVRRVWTGVGYAGRRASDHEGTCYDHRHDARKGGRPEARRREGRCREAGLQPPSRLQNGGRRAHAPPLRLASLVRWDLEKIDRGWPWRSWKKVRSTRGWRRKTLTGKLSAALPPYLRRCRLPGLRPGADRLGRRAGAGCRGAGRNADGTGRRSTSGAGAAMAIGGPHESRTRRDCRGCGRFLGWGKWYEDRGNR